MPNQVFVEHVMANATSYLTIYWVDIKGTCGGKVTEMETKIRQMSPIMNFKLRIRNSKRSFVHQSVRPSIALVRPMVHGDKIMKCKN